MLTIPLLIRVGWGCDQHGQNATKAAIRAARNAIEFNSLPAMQTLIPGGYEAMLLRVQIACPDPQSIDQLAVAKTFPYGKLIIDVMEGGMRASSGIAIEALGDTNDDMFIAVCVVTVGY